MLPRPGGSALARSLLGLGSSSFLGGSSAARPHGGGEGERRGGTASVRREIRKERRRKGKVGGSAGGCVLCGLLSVFLTLGPPACPRAAVKNVSSRLRPVPGFLRFFF
jgi:hypothetical protein